MKNHTITVNGRKFYTAQIVDEENHKTYDQTIIFEDIPERVPQVVNYYYGEPDEETTQFYINLYVASDTLTKLQSIKESLELIENDKHLGCEEQLNNVDNVTAAQYHIQDTMADIIDTVITLIRNA